MGGQQELFLFPFPFTPQLAIIAAIQGERFIEDIGIYHLYIHIKHYVMHDSILLGMPC